MASFFKKALPWLGGGLFSKKGRNFLTGTPESVESNLLKEQEPLYQQLLAANQAPGAGGSFGTAADYYRDLLSDDSQTAQAMFAPEQRYFNEDIIPGLAEQFAGMGSGNLSSSGFRNAAVSAGTDLSERLGAIRAQLRSQGAAGLSGLGQLGLEDRKVIRPGTPGFLESLAPAIGSAAGAYIGGPAGAQFGAQAGQGASGWLAQSRKGKSSPYGGNSMF